MRVRPVDVGRVLPCREKVVGQAANNGINLLIQINAQHTLVIFHVLVDTLKVIIQRATKIVALCIIAQIKI